MHGEESISIVRSASECYKFYRDTDPRGRWPDPNDWIAQLRRRAEVSRELPLLNPVQQWYPRLLLAVSMWIEAVRPTTEADADELRKQLPRYIGDITPDNIIVGTDGPVLIDFCVKG